MEEGAHLTRIRNVMEFALRCMMVFLFTAIADWAWALYIIETSSKNAIRSSVMAGLLILLGAFVTLSYVEDRRMLIPAVIGAVVGTYLCVKREEQK